MLFMFVCFCENQCDRWQIETSVKDHSCCRHIEKKKGMVGSESGIMLLALVFEPPETGDKKNRVIK